MIICLKSNPYADRHHWEVVTLVCSCILIVCCLIPINFPILLGHYRKKNQAGCSCGFLQLPNAVLENCKHITVIFSFFWSGALQWKILSANNANPKELKRFLKTSVKTKVGKKPPSRFQSNTDIISYQTSLECSRALAFQIHRPGATWSESALGSLALSWSLQRSWYLVVLG